MPQTLNAYILKDFEQDTIVDKAHKHVPVEWHNIVMFMEFYRHRQVGFTELIETFETLDTLNQSPSLSQEARRTSGMLAVAIFPIFQHALKELSDPKISLHLGESNFTGSFAQTIDRFRGKLLRDLHQLTEAFKEPSQEVPFSMETGHPFLGSGANLPTEFGDFLEEVSYRLKTPQALPNNPAFNYPVFNNFVFSVANALNVLCNPIFDYEGQKITLEQLIGKRIEQLENAPAYMRNVLQTAIERSPDKKRHVAQLNAHEYFVWGEKQDRAVRNQASNNHALWL